MYSINGFTTEQGLGMGHYGPSIVLSQKAVIAFLHTHLTEEHRACITTALVEHIQRSGRVNDLAQAVFYEDTVLLRYVAVGGDCACLGIDGNDLTFIGDAAVAYRPHNIDDPRTSAIALSTWLMWFNAAISLTDIEMPFAM